MKNCSFLAETHVFHQKLLFSVQKVHIKSEIWKNAAIALLIKDLKGLLEVA